MRPRSAPVTVLLAALVLTAVGALTPILSASSDDALRPASADSAEALLPATAGDAEAAIASLSARTKDQPENAKLHAQLGLAYLGRARDEADPAQLPRAELSLLRSIELQPRDNLEAFVGLALLGNARHDFTTSVKWSRKAIEANPYSSSAYGLLGDALFELGKVKEADAAYQQMVDVRPDVASYVRASYAQQHHGRTRAAIASMRLALKAAGPSGQTAAWVRHQLGDIYAGLGDYREAARQNRIGIAIAPGFVPPTVGLAESHIAFGRLDDAIAIMEAAAEEMPALEYTIKLGDLYRATGRTAEADAQYAAVADKLAAYRAAGVRADADFTVFYADHGLRPQAALREARAAYAERPTQKIADALAWALHAAGRDREAWGYARHALHGPIRSAPVLFHAGSIAEALGMERRADSLTTRAFEMDPIFSALNAPVRGPSK